MFKQLEPYKEQVSWVFSLGALLTLALAGYGAFTQQDLWLAPTQWMLVSLWFLVALGVVK